MTRFGNNAVALRSKAVLQFESLSALPIAETTFSFFSNKIGKQSATSQILLDTSISSFPFFFFIWNNVALLPIVYLANGFKSPSLLAALRRACAGAATDRRMSCNASASQVFSTFEANLMQRITSS